MYFVVKVGGPDPQHAHIVRRPIFLIRKNSFSILLYSQVILRKAPKGAIMFLDDTKPGKTYLQN